MREKKQRGVIQVLCEEIGVNYISSLETDKVLIEFVSVLVGEIEDMIWTSNQIAHLTDNPVSKDASNALKAVQEILCLSSAYDIVGACVVAHSGMCYIDDEGPCDHYIGMLSSCVSALRFGLEKERPFSSRHAAAAADHVWKRRYGVSLFDKHSNKWGKDWAADKFHEAMANLVDK